MPADEGESGCFGYSYQKIEAKITIFFFFAVEKSTSRLMVCIGNRSVRETIRD